MKQSNKQPLLLNDSWFEPRLIIILILTCAWMFGQAAVAEDKKITFSSCKDVQERARVSKLEKEEDRKLLSSCPADICTIEGGGFSQWLHCNFIVDHREINPGRV